MPAFDPDTDDSLLAVYLHWPFCEKICPYCDFNVARARNIDEADWRQAYQAEIDALHRHQPDRKISSIFFGGGTPSLMSPDLVASLVDRLSALWRTVPDIEITLEANPCDAESKKYRSFREAGVNRLSLGVQSLRDDDLKGLGRWHSAAEAAAAMRKAVDVFDNVSFDLIYGRPAQKQADWESELAEALTMGAQHLSLYQLTIEPGTAFERKARRGLLPVPQEDELAGFYTVTQELCAAAGMPGYEISNHAAPEFQSRHNLTYWRYGDYAGLGPGAHGRLTDGCRKFASLNVRSPAEWLERRKGGDVEFETWEELSPETQAMESVLTGLRLTDGYDCRQFEALAGRPLDSRRIARLADQDLIRQDGSIIRTTRRGRLVLDHIVQSLLV